MASSGTRPFGVRPLLSSLSCVALAIGLAVPAASAQSEADDDVAPVASFLAELLAPKESFAPVEVELTDTLPRSGTFQGIELTVDRVHLTNIHPYTLFGEPTPGELYYVVVEVTAYNPTGAVHDYGFGDETFELRTWSGRLLPHVPAPGVYEFSRLEPGESRTDELVFGSEVPDVIDGSALLVGRAPDASLVIPLTAPPLLADYPVPVQPAVAGPFQAGAVAWSVESGEGSLDRPPDVCCPDTGSRADVGEFYLTLQLSGEVSGSKYGQATVSSDTVRLVLDGEPVEPFGFEGQANVPEGEAFAFPATWLAHEGDEGLTLQFLDGQDVAASVPILVGADAIAAAEAGASPPVSADSSAAPASAAPAPSAQASPSRSPAAPSGPPPSVTPAPTPRPAIAAIATALLYSGVPDPDWTLTQADLDELSAIAAGLETVEATPSEGGLGYRGFRVTGPQGTWRVNEELVLTPDSAPGTSLADPERLVERYLLETGLETLTEDEAEFVADALDALASPKPG